MSGLPVFSDGVFIDASVIADFFHVDVERINLSLMDVPASQRDLIRVDNGGSALAVHRDLLRSSYVAAVGSAV